VTVPASATDGAQNTTTVTATSVASPGVSASAALVTQAVTKDWLLVDEDGNNPDIQKYYTDALNTAIGSSAYSVWDLAAHSNKLPLSFLVAYKHVVWFTGSSYPGPLLPYESELKTFLDGGGHLFMSGQDILDQAAGTTAFAHDYLHITWDGTEVQNDKNTASVTGVTGNPVTNGIGTVPLDQTVLGPAFAGFIPALFTGAILPAWSAPGSHLQRFSRFSSQVPCTRRSRPTFAAPSSGSPTRARSSASRTNPATRRCACSPRT
jgi:hypothetical protein